MALFRRKQARERRMFENSAMVPRWGAWNASVAGPWVTETTMVGVPAVAACIRLIAESIGMMPMLVYSGDPPDRVKARDSWQWELLHDEPNPDQSAFDFWQDVSTSIEVNGNAYIWKVKVRNEPLQALICLNPNDVRVKRATEDVVLEPDDGRPFRVAKGERYFELYRNAKTVPVPADQILHIRGWSLRPGADMGVSPITIHREALGKAMATEEFESRFFTNNASPSGAIQIPGNPPAPADIDGLYQMWMERQGGLSNAHKPVILTNGATWQPMGMNLQDAQFVEQKRYGLEDIARMFRISSTLLLGLSGSRGPLPPTAEDFERFLKVDLAPRLTRIETALARDQDLFPDGPTELFPEFLADAVLRPDIQTRYDAYRLARQGGWVTANEIREKENYPPHAQGDELQVTPVGGAPNEAGPSGPSPNGKAPTPVPPASVSS
jgi:HK97 family phage portal protein